MINAWAFLSYWEGHVPGLPPPKSTPVDLCVILRLCGCAYLSLGPCEGASVSLRPSGPVSERLLLECLTRLLKSL